MVSPSTAEIPPAFVTGARGFIGRRVVAELARLGGDVTAASHSADAKHDLPARVVEVDLSDVAAAAAAMRGCELVIHLAARSGGVQLQQEANRDLFAANQALTAAVLEASRRCRVRRVCLASSAVIYRQRLESPIRESDAVVSIEDQPSGYAWSKVSDEVVGGWHRQAGDFEVVAGRFANVYGPQASTDPARSTVIHSLVHKALAAQPGGEVEVWGDGSAVRSFVYVDDAAAALVRVATAGASGEAYNIDSGEAVTIRELAELIRGEVDPTLRLAFDPAMPTGARYRVLDVSKLRELGWEPQVDLATGIGRTVAAFRQPVG